MPSAVRSTFWSTASACGAVPISASGPVRYVSAWMPRTCPVLKQATIRSYRRLPLSQLCASRHVSNPAPPAGSRSTLRWRAVRRARIAARAPRVEGSGPNRRRPRRSKDRRSHPRHVSAAARWARRNGSRWQATLLQIWPRRADLANRERGGKSGEPERARREHEPTPTGDDWMSAVGSSLWAAGSTAGGCPYGISKGEFRTASEETNGQAGWARAKARDRWSSYSCDRRPRKWLKDRNPHVLERSSGDLLPLHLLSYVLPSSSSSLLSPRSPTPLGGGKRCRSRLQDNGIGSRR